MQPDERCAACLEDAAVGSIFLADRQLLNTNLPVYLTGTRDATYGSVVAILDFVKRAGIRRVAVAVRAAPPRS